MPHEDGQATRSARWLRTHWRFLALHAAAHLIVQQRALIGKGVRFKKAERIGRAGDDARRRAERGAATLRSAPTAVPRQPESAGRRDVEAVTAGKSARCVSVVVAVPLPRLVYVAQQRERARECASQEGQTVDRLVTTSTLPFVSIGRWCELVEIVGDTCRLETETDTDTVSAWSPQPVTGTTGDPARLNSMP